jgi:hypothetical protein
MVAKNRVCERESVMIRQELQDSKLGREQMRSSIQQWTDLDPQWLGGEATGYENLQPQRFRLNQE